VTDIAIDTPIVKEITADMQVDTIGTIVNVMDKTVVVQQRAGCSTVLDMGSLLVFAHDRQVLGQVFETFGPVELPFYSVRFNTVDEIDIERTVKGAPIGYVPAYERTQLVQVEQLKLMKGTDASNQYDEEAGVDVSILDGVKWNWMGLDGTLTDWFTFFCNVIGIGILGR
jgi:rRNA processing protein Gar1